MRSKNVVEPDRPQMTIIWRMRFSCRTTKATDLNTEYVILSAFPRQKWLRECTSILPYTNIACLVENNITLFVCRTVDLLIQIPARGNLIPKIRTLLLQCHKFEKVKRSIK
jgi:hypothetical protein